MPAERCPRRFGTMPTSPIPSNQSWPFRGSTRLLTVRGSVRRPARTTGYRQRLSGNELRAVAPKAECSPGVTIRQCPVPATMLVGRTDLNRSDNRNPMLTGFLRCAKTYMSGVAIGLQPTTTKAHRIEIRRGRKRAPEKLRVEVLGGTRSRSRDARLAPAFRQNSNTRTMAFGSCETNDAMPGSVVVLRITGAELRWRPEHRGS